MSRLVSCGINLIVSLSDSIRLPVEGIGGIAGCLVSDGGYRTAAHLSETCRAVHAEILPILYETMIIFDAETFGRSFGETDSKEFKHVKSITSRCAVPISDCLLLPGTSSRHEIRWA
jgi:hypothetical protein